MKYRAQYSDGGGGGEVGVGVVLNTCFFWSGPLFINKNPNMNK